MSSLLLGASYYPCLLTVIQSYDKNLFHKFLDEMIHLVKHSG